MMRKFYIPPRANILAIGIHPDTWERLCMTAVLQQKPRLLIMDCNSDDVLQLSANSLAKWGHSIHVLDPEQPTYDGIYNPLGVTSEEEAFRLARELATDAANPLSFTRAVSFSLLQAIILYLIRYRTKKDQNLATVLRLLATENTNRNRLFDSIRELDPDDVCVMQYDVFSSLDYRDQASMAALLCTHLSELTASSIQCFTGSDEAANGDTLNQRNFLEHCWFKAAFLLSHFHTPEAVPLRTIICKQILHALACGTDKEVFYPGMIMLSGKLAELVDKNTLAALNKRGIFVMLDLPHDSDKKDELKVMCHLITETPAMFQKGKIMLDKTILPSPAPKKLSNWNDCVPDDPKNAYHPRPAERSDAKRLEEIKEKLAEKKREMPKSRLSDREIGEFNDLMSSVRPVSSPARTRIRPIAKPCSDPENWQKEVTEKQVSATYKNPDPIVIRNTAPKPYQKNPERTMITDIEHDMRLDELLKAAEIGKQKKSTEIEELMEMTKAKTQEPEKCIKTKRRSQKKMAESDKAVEMTHHKPQPMPKAFMSEEFQEMLYMGDLETEKTEPTRK